MKKSSLILLMFPFLLASCTFNVQSGTDPEENQNQGENEEEKDKDEEEQEEKIELYSIEVTKNPEITTYYVGDFFDPDGLEITAHYKDKTTEVVTDYTYYEDELELGMTYVEVSYGGKTAKVSIVVKEKPTEELDEYTTTIDFHGSKFTTLFTEGTNFDIQDKFDQLVNYIDEQLAYYDLINQITCQKCSTRKVDSDTFLQIGTGSPAKDKFNPGEFVWKCKEKIYNVEINAFNYSNPYEDWQTHEIVHNVDNLGHIFIDDVDGSLEIGANDEPKTIKLSKSYEQGTSSFKLSSTGGRVLISSMTITWRG